MKTILKNQLLRSPIANWWCSIGQFAAYSVSMIVFLAVLWIDRALDAWVIVATQNAGLWSALSNWPNVLLLIATAVCAVIVICFRVIDSMDRAELEAYNKAQASRGAFFD